MRIGHFLVLVALGAGAITCSVDLQLQGDFHITCSEGDRCPDGYVCLPDGICANVESPCIEEIGGSYRPVAGDLHACTVNDDSQTTGVCQDGLCLASYCGDGVVDERLAEECDDGNGLNDDSCINTCEASRCGDGWLRAGLEECDTDVQGTLECSEHCYLECSVLDTGRGNCNRDPSDGCECSSDVVFDVTDVAPTHLALDSAYLYVLGTQSGLTTSALYRVDSSSSVPELIATVSQQYVERLWVDDQSLYWWKYADDRVMRVDKTGGTPEAFLDVDAIFGATMDDSHIYWGDLDQIFRQAKTGPAAPEVLVDGLASTPARGWAVDSSHLYWAGELAIHRVVKDGTGDPEELISVDGTVNDLVVDATNVFWLEDLGTGAAYVRSMGKDGNEARLLAIDEDLATALIEQGDSLYWSGDFASRVVAKSGEGGAALYYKGFIATLAANATHVFWGGFGGVRRAER